METQKINFNEILKVENTLPKATYDDIVVMHAIAQVLHMDITSVDFDWSKAYPKVQRFSMEVNGIEFIPFHVQHK